MIQHRTTAPTSPSDPESDEIICSNCGIGVSYKIQESNRPEKRAFSTEELTVKSRTSLPTALARHDIGVASYYRRDGNRCCWIQNRYEIHSDEQG